MKRNRILLLLLFVFSISFAQETPEIKWWNPANNEFPVISGQSWPDEVNSVYHRLPARAEKNVRRAVWNLSKQSAGLSIRFWTNANSIHVNYKVRGNVSMPHMPATGVSGLDLYGKSHDGEWLRCWGSYVIDKASDYHFIIDENSDAYSNHGNEYQLFLPLYNEIETLEIGVNQESSFEVLPLRKEKPVVAYGTSICQGACASRPGMAWTNILERKLERPVINLGFSGNGRLEPELIDLMTEIEAKVYILDCLPNLNPDKDDTFQLTLNAVKELKEKRPEVPIILTAHIGYANGSTKKGINDKQLKLNQTLKRAFNTLNSEGYTDIFLLQKDDLALGFDSYVDNIHPNDYGMIQYANAYEDLIREILEEPRGNVSTTIAITQSRDISIYKWEERHQEILALNEVDPPKICLFGNSIINFWGGVPSSSIARGQDSWKNILEPMGVRNFGFGWDRIENVLWRVYHDELDGFEAEQIVLMIGTNNLHLNNDDEIIKGLEELIKAIRIRQANSDIRMIGILPRSGTENRIRNLNLKISQLADNEDIDYKDIGKSLLLEDGRIDESLFTDGLHPNNKGYVIIAKDLQRVLEDNLSFKNSFELITEDNILKDSDYHNWGSSIIKGDDGKYHLFYSRWPGDFAAWLTFSEIAHATSDSPNGPWEYKETVLEGRGKGHWDAITAHNPKIKYFDGKYYLYYIATNLDDLSYTEQDLLDTHGKSLEQSPIRKMLRENQRTGVAFSSSLSGPWQRLDKPIIEPSGPITTLTVNPAIDKGNDGRYYLIVKGDKPNEERFIRNQAIAISESPIGPFVMQPKPVIDYLDTEDMSLWYDKKRSRFYGIFHAHTYLGLICSSDGVNWEKANDFEVLKKEIPMKNGNIIKPNRMERPFMYIENGEARTLCLAVLEGKRAYMVFVPITTDK